MSILPSLNHGTASSSSSSHSQSATSNHGFVYSGDHSQSQQSSRSFDCPSPAIRLPGQVAPGLQNPVESSEEINVSQSLNHGESSTHLNGEKTFHPEDASRVLAGSSKQKGKSYGSGISPSNHQAAVSSSSQTGSGHSPWRKSQVISGNHLLNFQYNPIPVSRPQSRVAPPRRQHKRKPYNKDLFFQANYKFVLLDSGNYAADSMDPDKMLCWEDIIFLKYSSPFPVQCPICLDDPLCPQITSCGHIFCFPCILQYFSMDEYDLKGECWKKCPLCFTMISSKELYTICIENVKQYHIGDEIEFILLTRQKDSFSSSIQNNERSNIETDILESFSKFTLTSDVELSVKEAMSELDSWIARADSGLVDDIERLPYVCAAMEQLENRKKYWNKRCSGDNKENPCSYGSPPPEHVAEMSSGECGFSSGEIYHAKDINSNSFGKPSSKMLVGEIVLPQVAELNESLEDQDRSASSVNVKKEGDSYNFYQAIDGQHIILHPLNMKCLLHHYGGYEKLPNRITGKILQMETVTQSETTRRRYRFLSHLSLTTTFKLCEIDLSDLLPSESLSPFMDEIKNRDKQRKRLARKEHKDKIKAEAADNQFAPVPYYSYDATPSFSMDDFEALGSPPVAFSPPTTTERLSFSNVARLGFAAAHDSPALKTHEIKTTPRLDVPHDPSNASGRSNNTRTSFADITSRAKEVVQDHNTTNKANEAAGKKGKKPNRVLLSTAGGRRY